MRNSGPLGRTVVVDKLLNEGSVYDNDSGIKDEGQAIHLFSAAEEGVALVLTSPQAPKLGGLAKQITNQEGFSDLEVFGTPAL